MEKRRKTEKAPKRLAQQHGDKNKSACAKTERGKTVTC
jgi:hypothetical protein